MRPSTASLSRRRLLGRLAILPVAASFGGTVRAAPAKVTIYSPAPDRTPLHLLNLRLADAARASPALTGLDVVPLALPQSVNSVAGLPAAERAQHWPIVTTLDFEMARNGTGPAWHGYRRANRELKFVSFLCDVGFGVSMWGAPVGDPEQLRGKRLAVPPRASAVRLMTELLLRDGWGIRDAVTLVEMPPGEVMAARAAGRIDGTSWNLVGPAPGGHRPTLPASAADPLHVVPVDSATLARVNAGHAFRLTLTELLDGTPPMLSFAQGLAAWDESDPAQIRAMLEWLAAHGRHIPGFAASAARMAAWPRLSDANVHPIARAFYAERGLKV